MIAIAINLTNAEVMKTISGSDFLRENAEVRAACKAAVSQQKLYTAKVWTNINKKCLN